MGLGGRSALEGAEAPAKPRTGGAHTGVGSDLGLCCQVYLCARLCNPRTHRPRKPQSQDSAERHHGFHLPGMLRTACPCGPRSGVPEAGAARMPRHSPP
jgi:hypothetical protein